MTEIATGGAHACAIQNGVVKCWGQNVHGQIGNGALITALSPATVLNIQPSDAPRNLTAGYFHRGDAVGVGRGRRAAAATAPPRVPREDV